MTFSTASTLLRRPNGSLFGTLCLAISLALPVAIAAQAGKPESAPQITHATFTNATPIALTSNSPAAPYPSTISVSGFTSTIPSAAGSIKVTFNSFTYPNSERIGIMLKGPTGQTLLLQALAGGSLANVTYSLSDAAPTLLPETLPWTGSTFRPANYATLPLMFPAPAPSVYNSPVPAQGSSSNLSSIFGGSNPNGVWSLYAFDATNSRGVVGSIAGGWSIEINTGQSVLDFDGDRKTDYALTRNESGTIAWYLQRSTLGFTGVAWGSQNDRFVPADYDGDGKWDLAVWRPGAAAVFYILESGTNTLRIVYYGKTGDDPRITQDFDRDGKADVAIARPAATGLEWYYRSSLFGVNQGFIFGNTSDVSIRGDYDGDGRADLAVYRSSSGTPANSFIIKRSSDGAIESRSWGTFSTDWILPGDFDGDGKTDIAVWRGATVGSSGYWYWLQSSNGAFNQLQFGTGFNDVPTIGDYDGDGRTDQAVWRSGSPGTFYVNGSTVGFSATPFGAANDSPTSFNLQAR